MGEPGVELLLRKHDDRAFTIKVALELLRVFVSVTHVLLDLDGLWRIVDYFEVAAQVTRLCEAFTAELASEGSLARVLAEVVAQVATFLEDRPAAFESASEEQPNAIGDLVTHFDRLVPAVRNFGKGLAGASPTRLLFSDSFALLRWRRYRSLLGNPCFCPHSSDVVSFLLGLVVALLALFKSNRVFPIGPATFRRH